MPPFAMFGLCMLHVFGMVVTYGIGFGDADHEGPEGPGRDNPRRWLLIGLFWEVFAAYWILYGVVVLVLYRMVICNRLGQK